MSIRWSVFGSLIWNCSKRDSSNLFCKFQMLYFYFIFDRSLSCKSVHPPSAHLVLHGHRPAAGRHRHPAHARPRHPRHQEAAHPDQEPGSPHLLLGSYWGRRGSRNCSHLFFRLIMDPPSDSLVIRMSLISYLFSEIEHWNYIENSEK